MDREVKILVALALSMVIVWLPVQGQTQMTGSNKMSWVSASNATALCNDYTRAGFFIRRNQSSRDWVVFLESGGLCYNTESCNRRFFARQVRVEFSDNKIPEVTPYGSFDPSKAWNATIIQQGRDPTRVITPLMTSMKCFENVSEFFPKGLSSSIEGRDILDPDPAKNPLFHSYNHVVIPYCSSDVWLGEETTNTEAVESTTSQCDCFNYTTASNQNGCFNFNPESPNISFTFRGKIIYQSIIQQLLADGMNNADKIILAGSSAGGLGVVNHAKWTRETVNSSTELRVFFDSAWFVDFQDGIELIFKYKIARSMLESNNQRLFQLLMSHSACNDTDRLGYPCCISAHCVMTQRNSDGELQYYPEDTPTFALFSIYDIYLLAPGLEKVARLESAQRTANTGDGNGGVGIVLDFMRIAGEYGGVMNSTLEMTSSQILSYYVTQCFQHIYLATSTLWGADGQSVFGSNFVELTGSITTFRHSISAGHWTGLPLATDSSGSPATILNGLTSWLALNYSQQIKYTDTCQGVLCNSQCPDELQLGVLTSNNWHTGAKIFIALLIIIPAVVCIIIKVLFRLWLFRLEKEQLKDGEVRKSSIKFPRCKDEEKISISCLNLHYSIITKESDTANKEEMIEPTELVELRKEDSKQHSVAIKSGNTLECKKYAEHSILNGISAYFNPGNLIGIMGPSGSGKTTLLDLLTGRRKYESTNEDEGIFINGIPIEKAREWYTANTGYVLQLAAPYYEELTVRENLTLAAEMKLPSSMKREERFKRVEEVMHVTGLCEAASTRVGGSTGPGLSGGQKKRLAIALQLLSLPSVIFLDEPTSGLDATASLKLLEHLDKLADSNRTVILTIHQPRMEIFGMFNQLVLLSDGEVAYHHVPYMAYGVFAKSVASRYIEKDEIIPSILNPRNPADMMMDMLGNPEVRNIITQKYQTSQEQKGIRDAITHARSRQSDCSSVMTTSARTTSVFSRMAVLEARADKRASPKVLLFLPAMFLIFGFVLGTTYIQVDEAVLVVSGMCVFSTASALFMFPALYLYYKPALDMYTFEKADGVGSAYDIVLQGFIRFASIALGPVVVAVSVIYLLLINSESYNFLSYLQVLIVNIALNQTWIALLIALICSVPEIAFRLSPIISAVAGFSSGFFIPIGVMHWGYRWLVYINPNYYGLSSVAYFILSEFQTDCTGNQLECYISSGPYVLNQFYFININPYLHLLILLLFTCFYLMMAIFSNWLQYNASFNSFLKSAKLKMKRARALRNPFAKTNRQESVEAQLISNVYSNEIVEGIDSATTVSDSKETKSGNQKEVQLHYEVWIPGNTSTTSSKEKRLTIPDRLQKLYEYTATDQANLKYKFMEIDDTMDKPALDPYEAASDQDLSTARIDLVPDIILKCRERVASDDGGGRVASDDDEIEQTNKMISLQEWKKAVNFKKSKIT